ncbi:energy-coupling factor transporter transmembrane component T [Thermophilibacter provencensis]|uniref:Energy-coupling factor transporter transmembrane component T n=1 Tax=Thermophilibacter provencensis TaxID=1852386 RepID=A0ABT7V114_9ACTN|nr:energy-coupling factor transporter transmembrane component T [Thermophilibacter provencensis]MDM8270304.1 energy-coupling factor transporter transmembrane component T [Thermophilibacter provencensis]
MAPARFIPFGTCHAAVPATLFAGVVALSMLAVHPVFVGISLAGALAFSLAVRGAAATARGLVWQLPLLALVCLLNPLFSASGSTLLFKLGTRSVYLESLAYGATMGALMVAVVLWFEGAAAVLAQDRLLALAGGRARALPLVTSMALQLVPQLLGRARTARSTLAACTAAGPRPRLRDELVRTSTMLLTWSLEDSVERADAMRARGWESGVPRTQYRPERLRGCDTAALAGIAALLVLCATCAWAACSSWRFYPTMRGLAPWWLYLPFALLAALPVMTMVTGTFVTICHEGGCR